MKRELLLSTILGDGKMPVPEVAICESTERKIELRDHLMKHAGLSFDDATTTINMICAEDPEGEVVAALLRNRELLEGFTRSLVRPLKPSDLRARRRK